MLIALMNGPLCVEALAGHLERNLEDTRELIEALAAIGVIERQGDLYANSPAATLYCQSVLDSRPPQ